MKQLNDIRLERTDLRELGQSCAGINASKALPNVPSMKFPRAFMGASVAVNTGTAWKSAHYIDRRPL